MANPANILGLIADEIEKEMMVSKEAFNTIDSVFLYKKSKGKYLYPLFSALVF